MEIMLAILAKKNSLLTSAFVARKPGTDLDPVGCKVVATDTLSVGSLVPSGVRLAIFQECWKVCTVIAELLYSKTK